MTVRTVFWRAIISGLLLATVAAFLWGLARAQGFEYPGGSDPTLWGLEAMNAVVGAPAALPPLFPLLTAWVHRCGIDLVPAGGLVAAACCCLVAPCCFYLALRLGATLGAAAVAGLLCLSTPTLVLFGLQLQPDALTTVVFILAALAAAGVLQKPTLPRWVFLVGVAGLAPLAREHGLLLSGTLAVVCVWARGPVAVRLVRVVLLLGAVCLAPLMVGQAVVVPWLAPWFERVVVAAGVAGAGKAPVFLQEYGPQEAARIGAIFEAGDRLGIAFFFARHALGKASSSWGWIATGLVCVPFLPRQVRLAPMVALVPVLSALFVYSEPRHVAVAVPVALAAWSVVLPRYRIAGACLAGVWLMSGLAQGRAQLHTLAGEVRGVVDLAEFGQAVCRHVKPGDLGAGPPAPFLFCPLPMHLPLPCVTAADWRTWVAIRPPYAPGWQQVDVGHHLFPIYRLVPALEAGRPCADGRPPADTPYRSNHPVPVKLEPPCDPMPPGVLPLIEAIPSPLPPGAGGPAQGRRAGEKGPALGLP